MTYFKGKCGEDRVQNHKYNISTKDGKSLVHANNWSSVVKKGTVLVMCMIVEKLSKKRNTGIGIHAHTVTKRTSVSWQMKVGYTGKNYHCSRFLLLNLGDYSRRCERNFCSNLGIIKVRYKPTHHSVVEFRNISLSIAKIVRQLFELAD